MEMYFSLAISFQVNSLKPVAKSRQKMIVKETTPGKVLPQWQLGV